MYKTTWKVCFNSCFFCAWRKVLVTWTAIVCSSQTSCNTIPGTEWQNWHACHQAWQVIVSTFQHCARSVEQVLCARCLVTHFRCECQFMNLVRFYHLSAFGLLCWLMRRHTGCQLLSLILFTTRSKFQRSIKPLKLSPNKARKLLFTLSVITTVRRAV